MDKDTSDAISRILQNSNFDNDEKKFIEYARTGQTDDISSAKIIATLILGKQLEKSTVKIIESNNELIESEKKHSQKMVFLTWALVFVGAVQTITMIMTLVFKFY